MAIAIRALGQPTLLAAFPFMLGLSLITGVFIGLVCDGLDKPLRRFMVNRERRGKR